MPKRIYIDGSVEAMILARHGRPVDLEPRSEAWMLGFAHAYSSTWVDGHADGWDVIHNGDLEYGAGFNAGTDLADMHRGDRHVVDLEEIL